MTSLYEVLKAQKMGAQAAPDYFTALWAGYTGGGSWETIEYTGAVPVTIYANGEPLIDWRVSGNVNQQINLFDGLLETGTLAEQQSPVGSTYEQTKVSSPYQRIRSVSLVPTKGNATISFNSTRYDTYFLYFDSDGLYTGLSSGWKFAPFNVTYPYVGIIVRPHDSGDTISPNATDINLMVNEGSTALPYVPYTPSPDSPVYPQETGERTGNFFDKNAEYETGSQTNNYVISGLIPNAYYTCSTNYDNESHTTAAIYFNGTSTGSNGVWSDTPRMAQANANGEIIIYVRTVRQGTASPVFDDLMNGTIWIMVNAGDTVRPYEPYGYKLDISCGGVTTPIYLGQVETVRQIRKLVLTGTNTDGSWKKSTTRAGSFYLNVGRNGRTAVGLCDRAVNAGDDVAKYNYGELFVEKSGQDILINLWLFDTNISLDDFKAYLAQQYAAGTPVTVWYVLATPATGVLNEPLRKIGDYADTVSAQDGVSIPTAEGENTFDVNTTLKPSEVYIKYKGRSS